MDNTYFTIQGADLSNIWLLEPEFNPALAARGGNLSTRGLSKGVANYPVLAL